MPALVELKNWSKLKWDDGVQLDDLEEFGTLVIQTENSTYEVTVIDPAEGDVLVRGGELFPRWTPVVLSGATFSGGSLLKLHGIYVGFAMELLHEGRQIVTSPVRFIRRMR